MRPFARHYRPTSLHDLVGLQEYKTILTNTIQNNHCSSVYLMTGTRGIGKTTLARIAGSLFSCNDIQFQNNLPTACGECESCKNDHIDIMEIDGASHNSVDYIKTLIEICAQVPLYSKRKVIIIDEVHMLSSSAFNAMLKLLEEPPKHVVFIFATTEEHKIPKTIQSRCQRFDFLFYSVDDMKSILQNICHKEKIEYDEEFLNYIIQISDNSIRESISHLDKFSLLHNNNIKHEYIKESYIADSEIKSFVVSLLKNDHIKIHKFLNRPISNEKLFYNRLISAIFSTDAISSDKAYKMYDIVNSHLTTYSNLSHINVFILAQKILNKLHGTVDFSGIISDSQEGDQVVTNESDEKSEDKQLNSKIKEDIYNTVKQDLQQNLQLNDLVNIGDETTVEVARLDVNLKMRFLRELSKINNILFHTVLHNCTIYKNEGNKVFLYTNANEEDLTKKWSSIANKFSYQAQFDFKNDIPVLIDEIANDSDLCQEINALFDSKLVNVKMK